MTYLNLHDKVVAVTGGSSGIGKAVAVEAARCGANVAIIARTLQTIEGAVAEIKSFSSQGTLGVVADVSDMASILGALNAVVSTFGQLDILVNCAGRNDRKTLFETGEKDWDEVIRVNLKGTFICCRVAAEIMRKQNYGVIINVSSVGAKRGATGPHYSASKAGIHGLSANLAKELAPYGIRVNVVAPGPIDNTRMAQEWTLEKREQLEKATLLHRLGKPVEVAKAILFLASDDASFITGEVLDVNGGMLID